MQKTAFKQLIVRVEYRVSKCNMLYVSLY